MRIGSRASCAATPIPGIVLGSLAVFFVLVTLAYSIKKRRRPNGKSATMMTWLWVHVYGGLLAFALATVHAGPGVVSFDLTSGKLLWFFFRGGRLFWACSGASSTLRCRRRRSSGRQLLQGGQRAPRHRARDRDRKARRRKSRELHEAKALLLTAPRSPQDVRVARAALPPGRAAARSTSSRVCRPHAIARSPV
jgi:hypothetical protein